MDAKNFRMSHLSTQQVRVLFFEDFPGVELEAVDCPVRSLFYSARIRVRYPRSVEKWIEFSIERVVHESVAHRSFVNVARLRITDFECVVGSVAPRPGIKLAVQLEYMVHECALEFLHVSLLSFVG